MPNELPTTLDEAIDLFTKWRANFQNGQTALSFAVMARVLSVLHHVQDAVHFRESTKMINGWHNARKDPPKKYDNYLVCIKWGGKPDPSLTPFVDKRAYLPGGWLKDYGEIITDWMPIPKMPKEARRD